MRTKFEWDPIKARTNLAKHGVTFEFAQRVFLDPFLVLHQDRIEDGEERWQALGVAGDVSLLVVAHTVRENGEIELVRIISVRNATRHERRRYEQNGPKRI